VAYQRKVVQALVKDGKAGFIQKDYYHGISQQEREIGLNP
jgi:hypothetical protein